MKKFVLTIEQEGNGYTMNATNEGFNPFELIAILDVKKNDLIEQLTQCENFTHRRIYNENGEKYEIEKEKKE